jgi:invasion protein IalB
MSNFRRLIFSACAGVLIASPGLTQNAPGNAAGPLPQVGPVAPADPAPTGPQAPGGAGDLSMGETVQQDTGPGSTYTSGVYGDWEARCVRAPEGQRDRCELYQLLQDGDGNSVAEITLFGLPPGQQAAAGATIVTPLLTLLTQQVTLQIDDGTAKRYPFTWCGQVGCYARIGFTADEIAAFKRGQKATITIVPVAAPDTTVELALSLIGFTAGYDAVNEANGL